MAFILLSILRMFVPTWKLFTLVTWRAYHSFRVFYCRILNVKELVSCYCVIHIKATELTYHL